MQSELSLLFREIIRERWLAAYGLTAAGVRDARENAIGAIIRYCRLADASRRVRAKAPPTAGPS